MAECCRNNLWVEQKDLQPTLISAELKLTNMRMSQFTINPI